MSDVASPVALETVPASCRCGRADHGEASIARAERRLRLLEELTEIGMALVRDLRDGAPAESGAAEDTPAPAPVPAPARDPADTFARLSRAIRLTLTLEARTDEGLRRLHAGLAEEREAQGAVARARAVIDAERRATALEDTVTALVGEVIEAESPDIETYLTLTAALDERLREDEAYIAVADQPLREIVERLCADLCLSPDWSRWTGQDWGPRDPWRRPIDSPFERPSRTPRWFEAATPDERRKRLGLE